MKDLDSRQLKAIRSLTGYTSVVGLSNGRLRGRDERRLERMEGRMERWLKRVDVWREGGRDGSMHGQLAG